MVETRVGGWAFTTLGLVRQFANIANAPAGGLPIQRPFTARRVLILLFGCGILFAQDDPPVTRLGRLQANVARLTVGLKLDTSRYMIGERGLVAVTISNGTGEALEIPDPSSPIASRFHICWDKGPMIRDFGLEWNCPNDLYNDLPVTPDDLPSKLIRPSESMTLTVHSDQPRGDTDLTWIGGGTMSNDSGVRLLQYLLGGFPVAELKYEVLNPKLEAWAAVSIKSAEENGADAGTPEHLYLLAVQMGGSHFVMLSRSAVTCVCPPETDKTGNVVHVSGRPFFRVATSSSVITSLSGTADGELVSSITYITIDGRRHVIQFDRDGKPI